MCICFQKPLCYPSNFRIERIKIKCTNLDGKSVVTIKHSIVVKSPVKAPLGFKLRPVRQTVHMATGSTCSAPSPSKFNLCKPRISWSPGRNITVEHQSGLGQGTLIIMMMAVPFKKMSKDTENKLMVTKGSKGKYKLGVWD